MLSNGKIAIVTGGAQGIGRACVERLANEGARVIAADTEDGRGNKLVDALNAQGHSARFVHADRLHVAGGLPQRLQRRIPPPHAAAFHLSCS